MNYLRVKQALNHNQSTFYMVSLSIFAVLIEQLADNMMRPLLQERLAQREQAIEVDIDAI